jgi:hypothetical protein
VAASARTELAGSNGSQQTDRVDAAFRAGNRAPIAAFRQPMHYLHHLAREPNYRANISSVCCSESLVRGNLCGSLYCSAQRLNVFFAPQCSGGFATRV